MRVTRQLRNGVVVAAALALALMAAAGTVFTQQPRPIPITMYKSPTCGCCGEWGEHMKANGFAVTVRDTDNLTPVKTDAGVPRALQSCHTAIVEDTSSRARPR